MSVLMVHSGIVRYSTRSHMPFVFQYKAQPLSCINIAQKIHVMHEIFVSCLDELLSPGGMPHAMPELLQPPTHESECRGVR